MDDLISRRELFKRIRIYEEEYGDKLKGIAYIKFLIRDTPTVEAVTREQFHCVVNDFFNEFEENGADEETLAKFTFIGLAFSNLERRLFESRDGDSE